MELRHLEVFLAIAEEGTLTAAGQRLHLVQSGISTTLRALESELGAALFTRTARRAVLTDVGAELVPLARATLASAAAVREVASDTAVGLRGPLAVGVMSTMPLDLPRLLGRFRTGHPHVMLSMQVGRGGSTGLLQALRDGELDLAFVAPAVDPGPEVHLRPLKQVQLHLLTARDHRLADREEVSLRELVAERWIDFPVGFGNRDVVDAACLRSGFARSVALEIVDAPTVTVYVEEGLGLAFVPEYVPVDPAKLRIVRLSEGPLTVTVSLATSIQRPVRAVVQTFAAFVEEQFLPPGGPAPGRPRRQTRSRSSCRQT